MKPLIKWPGGKRWLAVQLESMLPPFYERVIEPFAGGAALFFHLEPERGILNDTNSDLIKSYSVVKDQLDRLLSVMAGMKNSAEDYLAIRSWTPDSDIDRAARFLYLTRLSFNGIYRENRRGHFNVPYGHKTHLEVIDGDLLTNASRVLQS